MNYYFVAAAFTATVTFFVHTFIGGVFVARPLLADDGLPVAAKWLSYYCWHITTITIIFISAGYIWVALNEPSTPFAIFLTSLVTSFSVLSVGVALRGKIHPFRFPSTYLFAITALFGWIGLGLLTP